MTNALSPSHPDRFNALQSGRAFFLDLLAGLLRENRLISEAGVSAIIRGCAAHYDQMQNKRRSTSFEEEVRGLTASRISLVGDDDLELGIRLDNLCKQLLEGTSVSLWKTHQRYASLLGRPDMPKNDNPVGPRGITEGLNTWFSAADAGSLDQKFDLLDRIQVSLLAGLPDIYDQLDEFLRQLGVDSASPTIINAQAPVRPASAAPAALPQDTLLDRLNKVEVALKLPASSNTLLSQGHSTT